MKKRNRKNLVQLMATLAIMSLFLFGCGKTEAATDTNTEKEDVVAEAPAVAVDVEKPQEEAEVMVEPEADEAPAVEEPAEETLANEIIMNSDPIADWVSILEEEDLKFIIYNDVEGYKQILNDGETYHMKKNDEIFLYHPAGNVLKARVLTTDVPTKPGKENIFIAKGNTFQISWKDKDVVTYGEELTLEGYPEPKSITCTFYKAIE